MRPFVTFLTPILILMAALAGSGCGDSDADAGGAGAGGAGGAGGEDGDAGVDAAQPGFDPALLDAGPGLGERYHSAGDDDANYLFDDGELRSYELTLTPEALATLDADPAAEQYVEGALSFEGMQFASVGIRYKGSIGAWYGCVANMNFANPGGAKICDKLSIKVQVDWPSDDQRLYGLKKLQFHSMNHDASMMRERLGYKMFREMGVPAPRAVHARLSINGEYQGVFALVEQIDGRFTSSRFEDGDGNLYKEVWPISNQGTPLNAAFLQRALETNEEEVASGTLSTERMERFAAAVMGASGSERLRVIADWMDADLTMRYIAVDRAILNDDGVYHWYCGAGAGGAGGCAPHNFFWYEERDADRLYLVPWDMDIALTLQNPITTLHVAWDETTNNCAPYQGGNEFPIPLRDAACDPILGGYTAFGERFDTHSATLLDGPFAKEAVEADIDRWLAQIRDAVRDAASSRPQAITLAEVEAGVAELKVDLAEMRRRVAMRLGRQN